MDDGRESILTAIMIEPSEISSIVLELTSKSNDQLMMLHEDDRSHWLRELCKCEAKNQKLKRNLDMLTLQYDKLLGQYQKIGCDVSSTASHAPTVPTVDPKRQTKIENTQQLFSVQKRPRNVVLPSKNSKPQFNAPPLKRSNREGEVKVIEVVRNKEARAALPGHSCTECAKYFEALVQQGVVNDENLKEMMRQCSRHKSRWTPPSTPLGFWDLSIPSPDEWKMN